MGAITTAFGLDMDALLTDAERAMRVLLFKFASRPDKVLMAHPTTSKSEVVLSRAFEDNSIGSAVYLTCLYSLERLSCPIDIGANSLRKPCFLRGDPSVLDMTLFVTVI